MRRQGIALVLSVIVTEMPAAPTAVAQQPTPAPTATLTNEKISAEIDWERASNPRRNARADRSQRPYRIERLGDIYLNELCQAQDQVVGDVDYLEVDPVAGTERYLLTRQRCVPIPALSDGEQMPAPAPESVRDVVAKALPRPVLGIDPRPEFRGITGMDTWLWANETGLPTTDHDSDPATAPRPGVTVTAAAGPYTITASAVVVGYRWDTGDGGRYRSDRAGSREDPAAIHVYETMGEYQVTIEAVWTGTYTWTAGESSGGGDLGEVTVATTADYGVDQIRAVLVG